MKTSQIKTSIISAIHANTKKAIPVLMMAALFTCTTGNMYGNDKPVTDERTNSVIDEKDNTIDLVSLKGHSENQSDILEWEVSNATDISYFLIECSKNTDMPFSEVISINPKTCVNVNKSSCFAYKCTNNEVQGTVYYKVRAVYLDHRVIESNFISLRKTETVANLNISDIKNEGGQVTVSFKSPKAQNVTLNILNRSGQLLAVKDIVAAEGINTYSYDASFIQTTEMLIFSLNNQEEQITKKYMLATAW